MRAVSVSVNEETAVAGFILPGSRVDVSAAPKYQGAAKLILTDAEVGAVGQSMSRVSEDGKTVRMEKSVTLFLKPEEVQILHAYGGTGGIRLSLRGTSRDPSESAWSKLAKSLLAARPNPEPKHAAKTAAPHVVDLVRGAEYQKLVFDSHGNMRRFNGDAPIPSAADPNTSNVPPNTQNTEIHE